MDCEIPLLLSEDAMKKAEMSINVLTDTATIFEKKQNLLFISSRHYCIPLGNHKRNNLVAKGMLSKNDIIVIAIERWNVKSTADKKSHIQTLSTVSSCIISKIWECAKRCYNKLYTNISNFGRDQWDLHCTKNDVFH